MICWMLDVIQALPGRMTITKLNFREVLLGFLLTYGVDPYIPGNWIASSPLFGFFYVRIFNDLHKAEWKANYFTELHVIRFLKCLNSI